MPFIKTFVISCSSDVPLDIRKLYVWGSIKYARFLPETKREAMYRLKKCQQDNKCLICDAEIHEIKIKRTKKTLLQS